MTFHSYIYVKFDKRRCFIFALGTTIKDAGSKDKQFLVDYTYQYEFAKIACKNGVETLSLISSIGANKKSLFFYPKIKGKKSLQASSFQENSDLSTAIINPTS